MLNIFLFNSTKVICQVNSKPITSQNNIQLPLTTTCDSLPITFQKVIELTDDPLFTYDLLTYPNGDYLAVGNYGLNGITQQSYLIKYGPTGKIHWAKEYGASYPPNPVIVDWYNYRATISESMEGGIVLADSSVIIIGQYIYPGGESNEGYLVKVGFNGELIWSKTIDRPNEFGAARNLVVGINQTENGAIFITGFHGVDGGFIFRINESGQIQNKIVVLDDDFNNQIQTRVYRQLKYLNGYYYLVGGKRDLRTETSVNRVRGINITKFDENLNLLKTVTIFSPPETNRYIVEPLHNYLHTDTSLIIAYYLRNEFNGDEGFGLFGIDYNFNLIFNKIYEDTVNSQPLARIGDLAWKADGNILATFRRPVFYFFLTGIFRTNPYFPIATLSPQGDILEKKSYSSSNSSAQLFHLTPRQDIFMMGQTNDFGVTSPAMTIMRIDSSGSVGDCPVGTFDLTVTDVDLVIDSIGLLTDTFPYSLNDFFLPSKNIYPIAREVCCAALPDATVQWLLPAYACDDRIGLDISICNTGDMNLSAAYPITIYDGDPCHENANIINSFSLGNIVLANDCYQFTHEIISQNTDTIFMVLGDNGTISPIQIPCDFPLNGITEECDYYNNIKSVIIPDTIQTTIFQDDYFQNCAEDIILVAPYYIDNPVWNNNITNDTLIVNQGGWYYLSGTTPCGDEYQDSVFVTEQHPHPSFPNDTICQFDTLIFRLIYEDVDASIRPPSNIGSAWFPDTDSNYIFIPEQSGDYELFFRANVNRVCFIPGRTYIHVLPAPLLTIDTLLCSGQNQIQNQTFTLLNDTLLNFTYPYTESCDSTIQYQVTILDTSYQEIILSACQGDSLLFQNTQIAAGESQTFVNTKTNGCDSTLFVSVEILEPSPLTEISLDFCIGDSVLVFDDYQQSSGIYSNIFSNSSGCDSLVEITLTELPVFQTENLISLCSGASTLIHGQPETQSGFYEAIFTAENGCDSISFVELELFATANLEAEIVGTCPEEINGEIVLSITDGDGPFLFDWSDNNNVDTLRQNLASGNYTLTLTDVHGCTSIHVYTIPTLTGEDCAPRWYAPNAFSPNDDGRNDRFTFYANAQMEQIELLEIFDRGGNLVFRVKNIPFDDASFGWDGFMEGQLMNPQVFVWRAVVVDGNGVRENTSGDVTLIR